MPPFTEKLIATARLLMGNHKGLLAMDESVPTSNARFEKAHIPPIAELRQAYRELIVTTPHLGEVINGAILHEETIYQSTADGTPFITKLREAGVLPGIKVDEGTVDMAGCDGEKVTIGLDHLPERLTVYIQAGMEFAKWRAVITIGDQIPSTACIEANMTDLARYANICQQQGILPIVEPEVLIAGDHTIEDCHAVTNRVLRTLFIQLNKYGVDQRGLIVKPNMVTAGEASTMPATPEQIAQHTIACLMDVVPPNVPGIAFLSGGQAAHTVFASLNAMNQVNQYQVPWPLTYSFSRAIQQPALEFWSGKASNVEGAQRLLLKQMNLCVQARKGELNHPIVSGNS